MSDRPRARASLASLLVAVVLTALGLMAVTSQASAETIGFRDFSYGSATAPTGQKPQSKLWFNDGQWWGSLFNPSTTDFEIHRYSWASHTWTTTGTLVDERQSAYMDTLWDGTKLYVATAGATESNTGHQARIVRYSYDPVADSYTRDAGFPVNVTNAGVKAIVLAKDSTGRLWATYTQANRVWFLHSTVSDSAWSTPAVLPVTGASGTGSDEISAVVAYDGDRIGIMWSNQNDSTMYWASHADGAPVDQWSLEAAYRRPEGADDHINLKSLQSDASGRVFAAVKTSLNGATDPLIHLLVLGVDGTWTSSTFGTVTDQHTRAIVTIDEEHRQVYVFASSPCCSGGVIYMKQASLDDLRFPAGRGTPFIASDVDTKINNPTSTKQHVSSATGLVVLASDDGTRYYVHNRLALGGTPGSTSTTAPTSTTTTTAPSTTTTVPGTTTTTAAPAPDTAITSGPTGTSTSSTATFTYSSTVAGASFECRLDDAPFSACAPSGTTHSGLADGAHTFAVRATAAGVTDPTPATRTWTVDTTPGQVFFESGFDNGFAGWSVLTGGDGRATIESAPDPAARLTATGNRNSLAAARHALPAAQPRLVAEATTRFTAEGTNGAVAVLRLLDGTGGRVVTVQRRSGSRGQLQLNYGGTTYNTSASLPLGGPETTVRVRVEAGPTGAGLVELTVGGVVVHRSTTASVTQPISTVQIGSDTKRQAFDATFDDVVVREPT